MMDVAQADGIGNATRLIQTATLRQRGELGKDRTAANRRLRGELGTDRTTANVALRQGMLGDLQAELRPFQQRSKQQQFADKQFALNADDLERAQVNARLVRSNAREAAQRGVIARRIPSRSIRTPVRKSPSKMPAAYHITPTGRRITQAAHKRNVARGKALAKARNGGAFAARGNLTTRRITTSGTLKQRRRLMGAGITSAMAGAARKMLWNAARPALYSGARTGARYLTTAAHRGVNALSGAGNEWIESNLGDGLPPKKKPAKGKKGGAIGFTPYGMPVRMLAPARRAPAKRAPARRAPVKRRVGGGGRMPGQQPPFRYGGAVTTQPYIFRI